MSTFESNLINAKKLLDALGIEHPKYLDVHTLYKRLEENISKAELYGDTSDLAALRAQVQRELDKISLDIYGRTIDKLSGSASQTRIGAHISPHLQSETPSRRNGDNKLGSESLPKSRPVKGSGCSNLFQVIVGISTIVACIATILVVPPVNRAIETIFYTSTPSSTQTPPPTKTPLPTATDYTWDVPGLGDTPADSILEAEQIWYGNGLEIRLRKPVVYLCENTVLAFELSFMNTTPEIKDINFTGLDIIVTDQDGQYYASMNFRGGGITTNCYSAQGLSLLFFDTMHPGARFDYAFFIYATPKLQSGDYFFVKILRFGEIENATWKIPTR
jgi:hypothetical protein